MASVDQSHGQHGGGGSRTDRLVSSALGSGNLVQHPEERVPCRGASVGHDQTARARVSAVSGGGLACGSFWGCGSDEPARIWTRTCSSIPMKFAPPTCSRKPE